MKMIMIAYSEATEQEVMDILEMNGQAQYTQWTRVRGRGRHSEPHLLTVVWPKANNVIMACVADDRAAAILQSVRTLRKSLGHEGIKAFSLPVDDVTD